MKSWIAMLGAACLLGASARPSVAGEKALTPVYHRVDRATGAVINLFRPAPNRAVVEVGTGRLTVLKSLSPGRAETRVVSAAEDLTIVLDGTGVVVRDGRLGLTAGGSDPVGLKQARARLQASAAVSAAVELLDGLALVSGSPISHTLLVTQAMLESALERPNAGRELEMWARRPHGKVRALPIAWQDGGEMQEGPTDCWNEYAAEAIAAWIEYEQCVDAEEWWDAPGLLACLLIYDMRAIGAFSWWVSCVGFRG